MTTTSLNDQQTIEEELQRIIVAATEKLQAEKPKEAFVLLDPLKNNKQVVDSWLFLIRYGSACLSVIGQLNKEKYFGALQIKVVKDKEGQAIKPFIKSERFNYYFWAIYSYQRFLNLMLDPQKRQELFDKNGADKAWSWIHGIERDILHAGLQLNLSIDRIAAIGAGEETEDPFEKTIVDAVAPFNKTIHALGKKPAMLWPDFALQEKERYKRLLKKLTIVQPADESAAQETST